MKSALLPRADAADALLSVRGLSMEFRGPRGSIRAVDDVSFDVVTGETLGLVGESGCGKTATALSIAGLLPAGIGQVVAGGIRLEGEDLLAADEPRLRALRGGAIGFIFQDPMTSLNPTLPVGEQVAEPMRIHLKLGRREAHERAVGLLARAGIPQPSKRAADYPHQLSGGMRQRVMIAMAIACEPKLLIADEPTTALDVTIQAQILELLRELTEASGCAIILITHDLGVAARMCDRLAVMYAGQVVESAGVDAIFARPRMPYTAALMQSTPQLAAGAAKRLPSIPGAPPSLFGAVTGCRFAPRCAHATTHCRSAAPALSARGAGHLARCLGTESGGWIP